MGLAHVSDSTFAWRYERLKRRAGVVWRPFLMVTSVTEIKSLERPAPLLARQALGLRSCRATSILGRHASEGYSLHISLV